ncbi:alpha/beta fold hydrolase [Pseudonocardia kunmingensis]|uniref:Pimeloyl-ACP methyl ester carboxylesterase n=1 Tax=Pseudonocardia kunmingensis TaxID=630975 RepID=A0A543DJW4_9PSEU|nr:alpha/beta fold hydrolase [Pseudonocardia kunmingensis]TQM09612.1 pimeloyl-ACP methyl ester carboxylesterase [Pseudonocardia kunmingensis]
MSSAAAAGLMEVTTTAPAGQYADVNGLRLYYEVHGQGRPLVLLHGGLHTIDLSFRDLIPLLRGSHRIIGVELQGHGRTADVEREPTYPAMADDVVALLDHLGLARADVLGFSLGGLVALEMAMRHPGRVDRLVAAATHFRPEGYHDLSDPASVRMPTPAEFAEMRQEYERVAPDPGHFDAFAERLNVLVHGHPGWSAEELGSIAAPVLLVIGDTDFVRIEHAAEMLGLIPHAQLAVLPATRHTEVVQRTDVLVPALTRFLER